MINERTVSGICKSCQKSVTLELPIGYNLTCETCANYFHSCIQCKHYDAHHNKCTSLSSEPTKNPQSKNFCDEYSFSDKTNAEKPKQGADVVKKLEGLFKKSEEETTKPKKTINDLFKD
jgi:hypothetical protein